LGADLHVDEWGGGRVWRGGGVCGWGGELMWKQFGKLGTGNRLNMKYYSYIYC